MKKILLATAMAIAPAAVFAAAPTQLPFDGFVSLGAGYNWSGIDNTPANNLNGLDLEARGSAAVPVTTNIGFQADVDATRSVHDFGIEEPGASFRQTDVSFAAHLYYRPSSQGLIGIIGQVTSDNMEEKYGGEQITFGNTPYYIGGEGQYYLKNVTLYAQAAYVSGADSFFEIGAGGSSGVVLNGQVRFYPQPNWMVTALGGYSHTSMTVSDTSFYDDSWDVGLKTEYRLSHHPISFFAQVKYTGEKIGVDGEGSESFHSTQAMVGVKFNFGSHTLIERDHSGASLDPIQSGQTIFFEGP